MNRSQKKSSRKRMENRNHRRVGQVSGTYAFINPKTQEIVQRQNRMSRMNRVAFIKHSPGKVAAQETADKRKKNQIAARRALRKMRKETKQAMRRAAGF